MLTRITTLVLFSLLLAPGCSKKDDGPKLPECVRGELQMSVKISRELAAGGAVEKFDCPTRIATTGRAAPPLNAWVGSEPFWGPLLIVQLEKTKTEASRKAQDGKCIYTWSQDCPP